MTAALRAISAIRLDLPHGPVAALVAAPSGDHMLGTTPSGVATPGTALLVPGFTGGKEDFAPILPQLSAAGYHSYAIDLPGQFESPGPDEADAYSLEWLGGVLNDVAKVVGGGAPVHLVGHSFGGLVARSAALAEPSRYRSLTLLSSGPAAIGGMRLARMNALEPLLPLGMSVIFDAMAKINDEVNEKWQALSADHKAFARHRFESSSIAGLQGMGNTLRWAPDQVAELAALELPVLVAYAEHDDAWPPAEQAEMAQRLNSRHEVIADAAHSPAEEQPEATANILLDFWRDH